LSIDPKIKELVGDRVKKAVEGLEKSDFDSMMGLATRLLLFPEVFSIPEWKEEFLLGSFIIGTIAHHADSEFKDLTSEKKSKVLDSYSRLLRSFNDAVQSENAKLLNDVVKKALVDFYEIFGP